MIVVDASVVIEVLLVTPAALEIEERLFRLHESLHAPQLIDLEVAQVRVGVGAARLRRLTMQAPIHRSLHAHRPELTGM